MAFEEDDNLNSHADGINDLLDKSEHPLILITVLPMLVGIDAVVEVLQYAKI